MTDQKILVFQQARLSRPENIKALLNMPELLSGITEKLPSHDINDTKTLVREAWLHISQSKAVDKICGCTGESILRAMLDCAGTGLSLNPVQDEAYLVPFGGQCKLMPSYKGLIKVMINAGCKKVESVIVYDGEEFEYWRDENGPHWKHIINTDLQGNVSKVKCCYAVVTLKDGSILFEPMNRKELDKVKSTAKSKDVYAAWPTEMMRKAPIRRVKKYIPYVSEQLNTVLELDNNLHELEESPEEKDKRQKEFLASDPAEAEALAGNVVVVKDDEGATEGPSVEAEFRVLIRDHSKHTGMDIGESEALCEKANEGKPTTMDEIMLLRERLLEQ